MKAFTHSGIKSEFHKIFIKTGVFDNSIGKLYSELFDKRHQGDYHDFYSFEKDEIEPLMDKTFEFIKTVEEYIKRY
ncbi:MAG: HEPN domain-containing protein [Bacteroidota bacterium]|nr:HEPN domain-containing protein [Bacteroidota bacterium]